MNNPNKVAKLDRLASRLFKKYKEQFPNDDLKNYGSIPLALSQFEAQCGDYLDLEPLCSDNEATIAEYNDAFNTICPLILSDLYLKRSADTTEILFDEIKAQERWRAWKNAQPVQQTLTTVYGVWSNLGIPEKFQRGELTGHEWLTGPDIKRLWRALDIKPSSIQAIPLSKSNLGMELHFARKSHANSNEPYTIPLLVNLDGDLATRSIGAQGQHWASVLVKVDPIEKKIAIVYKDSVALTANRKAKIEAVCKQAANFQETTTQSEQAEGLVFEAYPDYRCEVSCESTGQQQNSWACGYYAVQNLAGELDRSHSILQLKNAEKLRNYAYQKILSTTQLEEGQTPSTEVIDATLIKLKRQNAVHTSAYSEADADLIKLEKLTTSTELAEHQLIQAIKQCEQTEFVIDLTTVISVADGRDDKALYQKALLNLLCEALQKSQTIKKITVNGYEKLSSELQDYFKNELDCVTNFVEFSTDEFSLNEFGQQLAARNNLLKIYGLTRLEQGADPWFALFEKHGAEVASGFIFNTAKVLQVYKENKYGNEDGSPKNQLVAKMGARYIGKILQYFGAKKATFTLSGCPYEILDFNKSAQSLVEVRLDGTYFEAFANYLNSETAYFPFKQIKFAGVLEASFLEKLPELLSLLDKHGVESFEIFQQEDGEKENYNWGFFIRQPEFISSVKKAISDKGIKTSLRLSLFDENLPDSTLDYKLNEQDIENYKTVRETYYQLQNIVLRNRRQAYKNHRQQQFTASVAPHASMLTVLPQVQNSHQQKQRPSHIKLKAAGESLAVDIEFEYEQEITQEQQQEQETQQEQQREQQIAQQKARNSFDSTNYPETFEPAFDLNEIRADSNLCKMAMMVLTIEAGGYGDVSTLVGEFLNAILRSDAPNEFYKVNKITEAAFKQLLLYPKYFKNGLNLNDLPEGFYLARSAEELVLCYNPFTYVENLHQSPLTVQLIKRNKATTKWTGTVEQFNCTEENLSEIKQRHQVPTDTPTFDLITGHSSINGKHRYSKELKLELLKALMQADEPSIEENIFEQYRNILSNFNDKDVKQLANLLYLQGASSVCDLLETLHKIQLQCGEKYYLDFKKCFIEPADDLREILTPEVLTAIEGITRLSTVELKWWSALTQAHIENTGWSELSDLYTGFDYFLKEFKAINGNLTLPLEPPVTGVMNMKIALDRMLVILRNAINVEEQLAYLHKLNLGDVLGPYYASQYDGYYLVTEHMELTPGRFDKGLMPYSVDAQELARKLLPVEQQPVPPISDSRLLFYRFLGRQAYIASFDSYVKVMDNLLSAGFGNALFAKVVFLLSSATTGPRNYNGPIETQASALLKALKSIKDLTKVDQILTELVAWRNLDASKQPNAEELSAVVEFSRDIEAKNLVTVAQQLRVYVEKYGAEFFAPVSVWAANQHHLPAENYSHFLGQAEAEFANNPAFIKLATLAAAIKQDEQQETSLSDMLASAKRIQTQQGEAVLADLLDILASIDVKKSAQLPTLNQINQLLDKIEKLANKPDYSQLCDIVLGDLPTGCQLNLAAKLPFTEGELDTLIKEHLETIIAEIKKLRLPFDEKKLRGEGGSEYLKSQVKIFEKRIPLALQQPIRHVFEKQHIQALGRIVKSESFAWKAHENEILDLINIRLQKPPVEKISQYIQTLTERTNQIESLLNALHTLKKQRPKDFVLILTMLRNGPNTSMFSIGSLAETLQYLQQQLRSTKFPVDILNLLLSDPQVAIVATAGKERELLNAIKAILASQPFNSEQKRLALQVAIHSLALGQAATQLIADLNTWQQTLPELFDNLLQVLHSACASSTEFSHTQANINALYITVMNAQDPLFKLCAREFLNKVAKAESFNFYSNLLLVSPKIDQAKRPTIFKIVSMSCDKLTTEQQRYIDALIGKLNTYSVETLASLASLYTSRPYPKLETLQQWLNSDVTITSETTLQANIANFEQNPHAQQRDLKNQFATERVEPIIKGITTLGDIESSLTAVKQRRLLKWFTYVNAIGHTHGIRVNPGQEPVSYKPVKDLSRAEISALIQHHRQAVQNPATSAKDKRRYYLEFVAIMREGMYRAHEHGVFPYSTQIMSALNALMQGEHVISEIRTGEGKSITTALFAALLWFKGQTVDVCTSDAELAKRDQEEFSSFYQYLGITSNRISADSDEQAYQHNGINYATVAELSLYRTRMNLDGKHVTEPASLVLDEADFSLLNDNIQYRFATKLSSAVSQKENPYDWVYPLVNEFVDAKLALQKRGELNGPGNAEQDIQSLRTYLFGKAETPAQKKLLASIDDKQLDTWIASSNTALQLVEGIDYVIKQDRRFIDEKEQPVSIARILIGKRASKSSQYSYGTQQLLHAWLNKQTKDRGLERPEFPIDAEKSQVAATNAKNFVDYYRQHGQVWGMTGTAGSKEELAELSKKYGLEFYRVPPHNQSKRIDHSPILADNYSEQKAKILLTIIQALRQRKGLFRNSNTPRPFLIICKDVEASKDLTDYLNAELTKRTKLRGLYTGIQLHNDDKYRRYNNQGHELSSDNSGPSEDEVLKRAAQAGMITVSTAMLGRGTDIKLKEETLKHGLFVIQTYIDLEREDRQIAGRSGRQGQPGETIQIIDKEAEFGKGSKIDNVTADVTKKRHRHEHSIAVQRAERERFGDIRNQIFTQFLRLQKRVHAISPDNLVQLLTKWQQYLEAIQAEWKQVVADNPKNLDKATNAIADYACEQWRVLVDGFLAKLPAENQSFEPPLVLQAKQVAAEALRKVEEIRKPIADRPIVYDTVNWQPDIEDVYARVNPMAKQDKIKTTAKFTPADEAISNVLRVLVERAREIPRLKNQLITYNRNLDKDTKNNGTEILYLLDPSKHHEGKAIALVDCLLKAYQQDKPYVQQLEQPFLGLIKSITQHGKPELKKALLVKLANCFEQSLDLARKKPTKNQHLQPLLRHLAIHMHKLAKDDEIAKIYQPDQWKLAKAIVKEALQHYLASYSFKSVDRKNLVNAKKDEIEKLAENDFNGLLNILNQISAQARQDDYEKDKEARWFHKLRNTYLGTKGSRLQHTLEQSKSYIAVLMSSTKIDVEDGLLDKEYEDIRDIFNTIYKRARSLHGQYDSSNCDFIRFVRDYLIKTTDKKRENQYLALADLMSQLDNAKDASKVLKYKDIVNLYIQVREKNQRLYELLERSTWHKQFAKPEQTFVTAKQVAVAKDEIIANTKDVGAVGHKRSGSQDQLEFKDLDNAAQTLSTADQQVDQANSKSSELMFTKEKIIIQGQTPETAIEEASDDSSLHLGSGKG